jgi:transcriptional regulator of heat shock response
MKSIFGILATKRIFPQIVENNIVYSKSFTHATTVLKKHKAKSDNVVTISNIFNRKITDRPVEAAHEKTHKDTDNFLSIR